jgi:peroxiredoxin Q/BCP
MTMAELAELNKKLPNFSFTATNDLSAKLTDFKGQRVILYFYPRDNTPGCTTEGQNFRDLYKEFQKRNTVVFGVSCDSMRKHENFKKKHEFPFELISDEDETLCEIFAVMKMKSMYGKKFRGIERSTFIIDENGKLFKEWRKVKVPGHVEEVLASL